MGTGAHICCLHFSHCLHFPGGFGCGGATGPNSSQRHPVDINTINLPAEMNKLLHPRKYFVGKIRPGKCTIYVRLFRAVR